MTSFLVTGASGFLGRRVCQALIDEGATVNALVRRAGSEPPGTNAVAGDLAEPEAIDRALGGARFECVIHLAAEIATQRDSARIHEVNVAGTERLLNACREHGVRRFVFASTVVTGDAGGALLEESRPLPVETEYGESKQAGERLVAESGLDWAVLRPSHIYGPGGWFAEEIVGRLLKPGRFAVVGSGANLWDVVHVDDVARAFAKAALANTAAATYHVADDQPVTYHDFVALTARELGVGAPRRVPAWLAALAGGRGPAVAATRSARSSNARIKSELGWSPRYASFAEGVPAVIAELRPQGPQ